MTPVDKAAKAITEYFLSKAIIVLPEDAAGAARSVIAALNPQNDEAKVMK